MNILSAIFKSMNEKAAGGIKPAGVVKDDDGWYYEESQNFSSSQSTIRIDQDRPGARMEDQIGGDRRPPPAAPRGAEAERPERRQAAAVALEELARCLHLAAEQRLDDDRRPRAASAREGLAQRPRLGFDAHRRRG